MVSGLNVGLLAATLWGLLRIGLLPRGFGLAAVAALAVTYALVTDLQPPVVRAAVMVLVACGARALGRRGLDFNTLAAAALVVLIMNPADLFRAGPQLSFLAVAALSWLSGRRASRPPVDPLRRLIARTRPWPQRVAAALGRVTYESFVTSSIIWLVASPLVLARFHLLSPAAVLLGPLLSLPVTVAMATGFGILATGSWLGPLAGLCGLICQGSLECLQRAVAWGQTWRGGHLWLPGPSEWWLAGFYLALAVWVGVPRLRPPRRWAVALACGWMAVGCGASQAGRLRGGELTCTVLAVGHGSAVVLELPDGRTLLYDAGHLGPPGVASRAIAGYLWSRGRTHLDAVVLSHADADHYNALPGTVPLDQHTFPKAGNA